MKKLLLLITSLVLTLGLACPAWADTAEEVTVEVPGNYLIENDLPESEGWIQPEDMQASTWSSSSIYYVFKKTSSSTCKVQVMATRPSATSIKSIIKVQINNGGTYNTISNGTATKSVSGTYINHTATYNISTRKTYRAKLAVQYVQQGITMTDYYYVGLDSNGY